MKKHAPPLRRVVTACLDAYAGAHRLVPRQWQVCCHVRDYRPSALGGLALQCATWINPIQSPSAGTVLGATRIGSTAHPGGSP